MTKGLKALEYISHFTYFQDGSYKDKLDAIEKELKALEIIKNNFKLVGNCLQGTNSYAEDGWVFVKEIEDEEELDAWKEVLL